MPIIRLRVPHLTNDAAKAEIQAAALTPDRSISAACAATIASWNATPGNVGALAALATGAPVEADAVSEEIRQELASDPDELGRMALQMLGWWVAGRAEEAYVLGEGGPLEISSITVRDLIGRYVQNENGAEFLVADVRYYLDRDETVYELQAAEHPHDEYGVTSLKGWTVL
jgi:hypothetical protein